MVEEQLPTPCRPAVFLVGERVRWPGCRHDGEGMSGGEVARIMA